MGWFQRLCFGASAGGQKGRGNRRIYSKNCLRTTSILAPRRGTIDGAVYVFRVPAVGPEAFGVVGIAGGLVGGRAMVSLAAPRAASF
jgi:hypothetical protein